MRHRSSGGNHRKLLTTKSPAVGAGTRPRGLGALAQGRQILRAQSSTTTDPGCSLHTSCVTQIKDKMGNFVLTRHAAEGQAARICSRSGRYTACSSDLELLDGIGLSAPLRGFGAVSLAGELRVAGGIIESCPLTLRQPHITPLRLSPGWP